ncbi:MAG: isoleucine--tRNA ligase [Bacteroidetes bacterium]|nr:MAG: isoleucine--tRNA ligase [Bacteroidota bacterium]
MKFQEYKGLDLVATSEQVIDRWKANDTFAKSTKLREGAARFVFFEGPPSANGIPGIHHVMARTIKDAILRYRTQKGYLVDRKAGWDTHGLPVELGVEKSLGITKEDIGKTISVEDYNRACREDVMKYTDEWERMTQMMGYWVDMQNPYITYDNKYIESLWYLLKQLCEKGFLYKGKTIQPYSPAAGTGLSTHELNQPGCYRDVSDTTVTGLFNQLDRNGRPVLENGLPVSFLAWTTTPWTLPSNTACAVGSSILYDYVHTFNPYTGEEIVVVLADARLKAYFPDGGDELDMVAPQKVNSPLPWRLLKQVQGKELVGQHYAPVFPWVKPQGKAYEVIQADFVTTEDGTGIVHMAPTFGADDARAAKQQGIVGMTLATPEDEQAPMVDRQGRFTPLEEMTDAFVEQFVNVEQYKPWAGRFVKPVYVADDDPMGGELDVDLCVDLKQRGKAFKIAKHTHSYPHCWRTDKPVLYYPLDSWFIKTTAFKERMLELNATINWKPASTGIGRFGKWLENLVDWNLSRSRYWGTPLPIWVTEDRSEMICIGSLEELKNECTKAVAAGLMPTSPLENFEVGNMSEENYNVFDLHRPYVDSIVLQSPSGKPMYREPDLIDVWFDSGAMPYAQWHYPFENQETFKEQFPASFIAEGVDQTRGWFFTLHAVATMTSDSVAFRNIISNGLVLDKNGNKMSKRLGNGVDPFVEIKKYGPDPIRWYMMTNSQPWENLKFDLAGVEEVVRKFFGTLYNTYSFFALYANVDGFSGSEAQVPIAERSELDRWLISRLNTLTQEVDSAFEAFEPTRGGRAIQHFVTEELSNWYVRLNRKRFWGGDMTTDKLAAYQTLFTALKTVAQLMAPLAPFYAERLYCDLHPHLAEGENFSVHLDLFPEVDEQLINAELEKRMDLAQRFTSLVLALRRKVSIKVRQPLARIMIPVLDDQFAAALKAVETIILAEVNVKTVEYLSPDNTVLVKRVKPNFKALGPKFGKSMKAVAAHLTSLSQEDIATFERDGSLDIEVGDIKGTVEIAQVEIVPEDIPGWLVATDGELTIALDVTITPELRAEGIAREVVNRVQNLRKETGLEVTDRIRLWVNDPDGAEALAAKAVAQSKDYIQGQTLASALSIVEQLPSDSKQIDIEIEGLKNPLRIALEKDE